MGAELFKQVEAQEGNINEIEVDAANLDDKIAQIEDRYKLENPLVFRENLDKKINAVAQRISNILEENLSNSKLRLFFGDKLVLWENAEQSTVEEVRQQITQQVENLYQEFLSNKDYSTEAFFADLDAIVGDKNTEALVAQIKSVAEAARGKEFSQTTMKDGIAGQPVLARNKKLEEVYNASE